MSRSSTNRASTIAVQRRAGGCVSVWRLGHQPTEQVRSHPSCCLVSSRPSTNRASTITRADFHAGCLTAWSRSSTNRASTIAWATPTSKPRCASLGRQPTEQVRSHRDLGSVRRDPLVSVVNQPSKYDHIQRSYKRAGISSCLGRQPTEQVRSHGSTIDLATKSLKSRSSTNRASTITRRARRSGCGMGCLGRQPTEQVRSRDSRRASSRCTPSLGRQPTEQVRSHREEVVALDVVSVVKPTEQVRSPANTITRLLVGPHGRGR